ncbi:MAG TPA: DUF3237 domain-containing protein, partial [Acidimicrobiales bacterium]|nr:DUF3237 domain-containing protein [Acidimicrobiales bacterium]
MNTDATHLDSLPVEFLYRVHLDTAAPVMVPGGPLGTRILAPVTGGTFEGPKMRGTVVGPAGDWVTVSPAGVMVLDVRLCLVTDDGAAIYCTYRGVLANVDGVMRAKGAPLFETGDERYAWLNGVQAIGMGTADAGGVDYDIYVVL